MGVVYGDIGTSPIYAFRESLHSSHGIAANAPNVLGVLSLIFWSLIIVISVKYLGLVMRADNRGEGGVIALTALISPPGEEAAGRRRIFALLGLFGAALLYGDSVITPAISVLSAVVGLEVATSAFEPFVIPITVGILLGLFLLQGRGTEGVGAVFGPVTLVWFLTLGVLGASHLVREPGVVRALNPLYGLDFFARNGMRGFLVLGSVFLVVTGGEALYADMGHFGTRPIRLTWFGLVLPCLLLNYFGQGAMLLGSPGAVRQPFFLMAPGWALYPLVGLTTVATVIASQAVISGAFSLTRQAVGLGYFPRLDVEHTSVEKLGQIYLPAVNWALMIGCVGLVLGFGTSSDLAAAYGVAVTTDMVFTREVRYLEDEEDRLEVRELGEGIHRARAYFGFAEDPDVPALLERSEVGGRGFDIGETTFFLGREMLLATERPGMAQWRERLFAFMSRNAERTATYFHIPSDRVVEVGTRVEL